MLAVGYFICQLYLYKLHSTRLRMMFSLPASVLINATSVYPNSTIKEVTEICDALIK